MDFDLHQLESYTPNSTQIQIRSVSCTKPIKNWVIGYKFSIAKINWVSLSLVWRQSYLFHVSGYTTQLPEDKMITHLKSGVMHPFQRADILWTF